MVDTGYVLSNLAEDMLPQTIICIDKVAQRHGSVDRTALAMEFYKELAKEYKGDALPVRMRELRVDTSEKLLAAVDVYMRLKQQSPEAVFYIAPEPKEEPSRGRECRFSDSEINDIVLFVIDNIVTKTNNTDRYDVMSHVCEVMEHRFGAGTRLEYNLEKLNLKTTKDVLRAIDIYFIMKKLFPDTVFGRQRMHSVWDKSFDACLAEKNKKEAG